MGNIKIRTLGWADITANERRKYSKKFLVGNFHNTKSVRKQRKRWEGIVERDALLFVGVRGWE